MKTISSLKRGIVIGLTLASLALAALVVDTALYVRNVNLHGYALTEKGAR